MVTVEQPGRVQLVSLITAIVWSAALPVAGVTFPAYRMSEEALGGISSSGSDTLVGVNGYGVLLILLVPLLVSLLVFGALLGRNLPGAVPLAWILAATLLCGTALAMLTIGIFVLPVAVALLVACAAKPARPA